MVLLLVAAVLTALAPLVFTGRVWPNRWFAAGYEVRGVDVSHYQGEIDWAVLARQDLDFAYIKATEGASHVDERFAENWAGATSTPLVVGAYHFLSFESSGEAQAANLIATVPATPGTLPPVVDLEYYGSYAADPPRRAEVQAILDPMLEALAQHYGVPPVVYATQASYDRYLRDDYPGTPIWIRSVAVPPRLSDGRDWTFWQYSNRDRLDGYAGSGAEQYIDVNVFAGSRAELSALAQP